MKTMEQIGFLETLYSGLAEALASPGTTGLPEWLAFPGIEWPFFAEIEQFGSMAVSESWVKAAAALRNVAGSTPSTRQQEYEQLFVGQSRPPIWLYESYYLDGRILGPSSFKVSTLYAQSGLEVEGSELPDHVAIEMAFLAYLVHQQNQANTLIQSQKWIETRKLFIKEHAGIWLPKVSKALITSDFPAWSAIGYLLNISLEEEKPAPSPKNAPLRAARDEVPRISRPDDCILCGFCVQICPSHALTIREDKQATALWLSIPGCIHCNKCVRVCPEHIIEMVPVDIESDKIMRIQNQTLADQQIPLYQSPRVECPRCGEPTVSRAELDYVIKCIGHPNWLDYCTNCRGAAQNMVSPSD